MRKNSEKIQNRVLLRNNMEIMLFQYLVGYLIDFLVLDVYYIGFTIAYWLYVTNIGLTLDWKKRQFLDPFFSYWRHRNIAH